MRGKTNIAVIGLGARGLKFCEAVSNERVYAGKLVAVCDPTVTKLQDKLEKYNVKHYDDVDMMLKHQPIDVAIVALPHHAYLDIIKKLAEHKVHIIKEKPFSVSLNEAYQFNQILETHSVEMLVAVQRRFDPHYQIFKKMISKIGKISHIQGKYTMNIQELGDGWRASKSLSGGGALLDMGYHLVDLLIWCFGQPDDISLSKTQGSKVNQQYDVEDSAILNFEYFNNSKNMDEKTIGSLFISRAAHVKKETLIVQGQKGCIKLTPDVIKLYDMHNQLIYVSKREMNQPEIPLINMVNHFIAYLNGNSPKLKSGYIDHLQHIRLIDAAYRSDRSYLVKSHEAIKQKLTLTPPVSHGIKREREDLSVTSSPESSESVKKKNAPETEQNQPDFVWPLITEETKQAVLKQLTANNISIYNRSGIFKEFEDRFAAYHNRKYALVTNSGTNAIFAMFEGIALMPGDEVIVPTFTFHATLSPLMYLGVVPVFCDALPNGTIDPTDVARKISSKTKAVIVTHLWGIPCDMDPIVDICRRNHLKLLEDCSHAHGARYKGRLVGTFGDAAAWSLNGQKIISGGEGGIILTDDKEIEIRANLQGQYNGRAKQIVPKDHRFFPIALTGFGLKNRAITTSIAMANEQFSHLDDWLKFKRLYAEMFISRLSDIPFISFPDTKNTQPAWYAFTFYFDAKIAGISREDFISRLNNAGLKEISSPGSTCAQHRLPLFQSPSQYRPGNYDKDPGIAYDCPVADALYLSTVKLPMWARPEDLATVNRYIDGIRRFSLEMHHETVNMDVDHITCKNLGV